MSILQQPATRKPVPVELRDLHLSASYVRTWAEFSAIKHRLKLFANREGWSSRRFDVELDRLLDIAEQRGALQ